MHAQQEDYNAWARESSWKYGTRYVYFNGETKLWDLPGGREFLRCRWGEAAMMFPEAVGIPKTTIKPDDSLQACLS